MITPCHFPRKTAVLVSLCLIMMGVGCAGPAANRTSVSSWKIPGWGGTKASQSAAEEEENPFIEDQEQTAKTVSATTNKEVPAAAKTPEFDAATMMLIETEFKDTTAEEREKWYRELRQVPPAMVPKVLQIRRLANQYAAKMETKTAAPTPQEPPQNSPQTRQLELAGSPHTSAQSLSGSQNSLSGEEPWNRSHAETAEAIPPTRQVIRPVNNQLSTQQVINLDAQNYAGPNGSLGNLEDYEEALELLISMAEGEVAGLPLGDLEVERQNYRKKHVYLRMLYLMANRQERALEAIPNLPAEDQEFWQQMFWAISNYFDTRGIPNPADRATHTVSQLNEATARLRKQANLELRNVTFSTGIQGFGIYDRFERDEFRPGQPVLIYAEVRNFLSEPNSEGQYKTVLKSTIEIHKAGSGGGMVIQEEYPPTEDFCRTRRHDYYHSYKINIPQDLTIGPYRLKLIVEDQQNRKVASYTINFHVK